MKCARMCVLLLATCVSSLENRRPNFVLIVVDDLGIGDLGCYGNTTLRTPNIDRLAQDGIKLTHHIAAAPLCTPSRAALLTGRYPIRSGMAGPGRLGVFIFSAGSGGLPAQELTFAEIAKQQGYKTALIGKWHLGLNCDHRDDHCHHPINHGFDHFYGIPLTNLRDCQAGHSTIFVIALQFIPLKALGVGIATMAFLLYRGMVTIRRNLVIMLLSFVAVAMSFIAAAVITFPNFNCLLMRNGDIVEQPYVSENLTQRMTHEAVDFLERNSAERFLLVFSFIQVHTALFASRQFRGSSLHGIYGDAVHEVDWSVGQIIDTLDRLALRENTLVYMTSDQGAHLEEISASGEVHRGWNGIYKAGKSTNWEGGIRVPGILHWPGTLPARTEIGALTSNMDIFPTVVRLTGAKVPEDREIDGFDLMPLLQGRVQRLQHEFMFHYCNAYLNAVRWNPGNSSSVWKAFYFTPNFYPENETSCSNTLVCYCTPGYVTYHDPPLLYDLSRDPSESQPLSPDTEPEFHSVLAAMDAAVQIHRSSLRPADDQLSLWNVMWKPWLQPCCSTLGYLCSCRHDKQRHGDRSTSVPSTSREM